MTADRYGTSSLCSSNATREASLSGSALRLGEPQGREPMVDRLDHSVEVAEFGLVLSKLTPQPRDRQGICPRYGHGTQLLVLPGDVRRKNNPLICQRTPKVGSLQGVGALRSVPCGHAGNCHRQELSRVDSLFLLHRFSHPLVSAPPAAGDARWWPVYPPVGTSRWPSRCTPGSRNPVDSREFRAYRGRG